MAEAAVEDRPPQRFYCHMCNIQFENASANFTCPHCSNGFIEELESRGDNSEDIDITDSDEEPYQQLLNYSTIDLLPMPSEDRMPGRTRYTVDPARRRRYASVHPRHRIRPRTLTRISSAVNSRQHTPFENLIQEFIVNLGVGVNWGGGSNMQLFFSNPGDYAWGREGLDAIVTQLLNQMDTTGPPPLSKDVIDSLPSVEITEEQVEQKLQCSVCWEDFILKELVRQLPCQHVYHESCIRPWLELHGTCPICRQNLGNPEENQSSESNNTNALPTQISGTSINALHQLFQAVSNSGNMSNGSSSSSSAPDTSGNSSNSDSII